MTAHRSRLAKAEATMLGCLGPSAQAVVRGKLSDGDIAGAWEALGAKYAPADDSDVITQLNAHLRCLRVKSPIRLEEYFNQTQVLQDALGESGAMVRESEMVSIIKAALLDSTEGRATYQQTFVNSRQMGWSLEQLVDMLTSDCHELVQNQGIADLKTAEFKREMQRRNIVPAQSGKDISPNAAAGSVVVPGTDGISHADVPCYKCKAVGHYARKCPTSKARTGDPGNPPPKSAAAKTAKATKETAETEAFEELADQKGPAKAKKSIEGKGPAASSATTGSFFKEEDDEYGDDGSSSGESATEAHMATAELFRKRSGGSKRRA
jgi:hypothetical protein